jgi:uncharacterized membrane protein
MMSTFLAKPLVRGPVAIALGVIAYFITPSQVTDASRLLVGWNAGAIFLIVALAVVMYRSDAAQTAKRSQEEEPSNIRALLVVILTSVVGLVGTATLLDDTRQMSRIEANLHLALSMMTAVTAWWIVHTYFALTYARTYYDETGEPGPENEYEKGLAFPDAELVDYWDFMYYSLTIAMCYQTSDVTVTSRRMRHLSIAHSLVSFFFITGIIGLVVNLVSNVS